MGGRGSGSGFKATHKTVDGRDISGTWQLTPFDADGNRIYPIEDIIKTQGFDGLPQVVSNEEFIEAVKESGLVLNRVYSASSLERLNEYQKSLYEGDWYVQCNGGTVYGNGMYCIRSQVNLSKNLSSEKVTEDMLISEYARDTMESFGRRNHYNDQSKTKTMYHKFETFTMAKNTKYVQYDAIRKEYLEEDVTSNGRSPAEQDIGTYAASKGYDIIIVNAKGYDAHGNYTDVRYGVVLNRTKMIIRRGADTMKTEKGKYGVVDYA